MRPNILSITFRCNFKLLVFMRDGDKHFNNRNASSICRQYLAIKLLHTNSSFFFLLLTQTDIKRFERNESCLQLDSLDLREQLPVFPSLSLPFTSHSHTSTPLAIPTQTAQPSDISASLKKRNKPKKRFIWMQWKNQRMNEWINDRIKEKPTNLNWN